MCCYRACFFQSLEPNLVGSGSQGVFYLRLLCGQPLALQATPNFIGLSVCLSPSSSVSLTSPVAVRGYLTIGSVSAIARWVSLHSLSMFQSCLNRIFLSRKKIVNVFNDLLINPLISLINKNVILIHFI